MKDMIIIIITIIISYSISYGLKSFLSYLCTLCYSAVYNPLYTYNNNFQQYYCIIVQMNLTQKCRCRRMTYGIRLHLSGTAEQAVMLIHNSD